MRYWCNLKVGPACFRIGSVWKAPIAQLKNLYSDFSDVADGAIDYTIRLEPTSIMRRWVRPSIAIDGDYMLPDAAPLPLDQGLLAAEMGMNLQMALGWRRHMLLHASAVEKDGKALIMTGLSGSGKSTMAAMLAERGWRYLGDEFALVDCATGALYPFPRPTSLKNQAIDVMHGQIAGERFGPLMQGTPKGDVQHMRPRKDHIAAMERLAQPALLLFPSFGLPLAIRQMGEAEIFVRLTQASTNYDRLGEQGFRAMGRIAKALPTRAIDYPDGEAGIAAIEDLWAQLVP